VSDDDDDDDDDGENDVNSDVLGLPYSPPAPEYFNTVAAP